jgi:hypothetical protein
MFVILMKNRHGEITYKAPMTQGVYLINFIYFEYRNRRTIKGIQKEGWCCAKAQASIFKIYFLKTKNLFKILWLTVVRFEKPRVFLLKSN